MTGSIGGGLIARAKPRMATIEATITRADGTVEHRGVVSYYHRNPLKRIWWRLKQIGRKR
jgi:hypothetical protein